MQAGAPHITQPCSASLDHVSRWLLVGGFDNGFLQMVNILPCSFNVLLQNYGYAVYGEASEYLAFTVNGGYGCKWGLARHARPVCFAVRALALCPFDAIFSAWQHQAFAQSYIFYLPELARKYRLE